MDSRAFELFGIPHFAAMGATGLAAICMVSLNRSTRVSDGTKHRINGILGVVLIIAVTLDPILTWLRYREQVDLASRLVRETALPFYLCDVVSVVLAYALIKRKQRFAEIGYLWGMAGTMQGLITPTLYFSWKTPEYYAFFAQHGGVPVAALTLAFGTTLKPQTGAFKRAMLWSWSYMIVVYGLNLLFRSNYGFLNEKPGVGTLFDYMGSYPWYLITLQVVAFSLYLLLLIPFRSQNKEDAYQCCLIK
jgi:hypothetical integral membrane protein (TIGR02206 family)